MNNDLYNMSVARKLKEELENYLVTFIVYDSESITIKNNIQKLHKELDIYYGILADRD